MASESPPISPSAPPAEQQSAHPFSVMRSMQTVISVAVVMATLLTLWTPSNLFSNQLLNQMLIAMQATDMPMDIHATITPATRVRIGIVSGHWGNDAGAVCPDGLTEEKVNLRIATLVQQYLIEEGYEVDLLQEFDSRLMLYQALAVVSIHNDSCQWIGPHATGFKVAAAESSAFPEKASRLTACLIDRYGSSTGLQYHPNTITPDMTSYHAFNEVHVNTTAAIIETGFLNLDRQILTEQADLVARGVAEGILCYIRNEPVSVENLPRP